MSTYDTLKTEVVYDSLISEGDILVLTELKNDDFSCNGICKLINNIPYIEEEKAEKARQLAIQRQEKARQMENSVMNILIYQIFTNHNYSQKHTLYKNRLI